MIFLATKVRVKIKSLESLDFEIEMRVSQKSDGRLMYQRFAKTISDAEQAIKCFEFPGNDNLLVICYTQDIL